MVYKNPTTETYDLSLELKIVHKANFTVRRIALEQILQKQKKAVPLHSS